jgi:hypothetical protein
MTVRVLGRTEGFCHSILFATCTNKDRAPVNLNLPASTVLGALLLDSPNRAKQQDFLAIEFELVQKQ